MACAGQENIRTRAGAGDLLPVSGLGPLPPYRLPEAAMEQSLCGETRCQQADPQTNPRSKPPKGCPGETEMLTWTPPTPTP